MLASIENDCIGGDASQGRPVASLPKAPDPVTWQRRRHGCMDRDIALPVCEEEVGADL